MRGKDGPCAMQVTQIAVCPGPLAMGTDHVRSVPAIYTRARVTSRPDLWPLA